MVLIFTLLAATLFGYSVGMIVGLKVQVIRAPRPRHTLANIAVATPVPSLAETRIEHPAAANSGVGRIHSFM